MLGAPVLYSIVIWIVVVVICKDSSGFVSLEHELSKVRDLWL